MARKVGAEKRVERSGSAVARVEGLDPRLVGFSCSAVGSEAGSFVRGKPVKARGADSLEKRVSKELKNVWKESLLPVVEGGDCDAFPRRLAGIVCDDVPCATIFPPTCCAVTSGVIGRAILCPEGFPRAVARLLAMDDVRSLRGGRRIESAARLAFEDLDMRSLDSDFSLEVFSATVSAVEFSLSWSIVDAETLDVLDESALANRR
jgi:hypothetical protein